MDIKNLKPNPKSKYTQGYFDKYNPKKYFGRRPIIYRSSLELIFMRKLENNNLVEKWTSEDENAIIPYILIEKVNGKVVQSRHNYHTDFTVYFKDGRKFIVEIKPYSLSPLNESQIRKNPQINKNYFKWKAAIQWCKLNNFEFKVLTEKHLQNNSFAFGK